MIKEKPNNLLKWFSWGFIGCLILLQFIILIWTISDTTLSSEEKLHARELSRNIKWLSFSLAALLCLLSWKKGKTIALPSKADLNRKTAFWSLCASILLGILGWALCYDGIRYEFKVIQAFMGTAILIFVIFHWVRLYKFCRTNSINLFDK